tara:strand:+ start:376 stop:780 length:405 start_codon:yes stop_codon:yes gene_type:complete
MESEMPTEEYQRACKKARTEYEAAWAAWQEVFDACWKANPGWRDRVVQEAKEAAPQVFVAYLAAAQKVEGLFRANLACPVAQALCAREGVDIGDVTLIEEWQGGYILGRQGRWLLLAWQDDDEAAFYGHMLLAP